MQLEALLYLCGFPSKLNLLICCVGHALGAPFSMGHSFRDSPCFSAISGVSS